jgi:hypothetical protein
MQTQDFLNTVLGSDGYICIFGANAEKKRVVQKLYPTIDAAAAAATNLQEEGFDAYFGLATFATDKSRKAENAKHLKSFFLDIDCGPHKSAAEGYPGGQTDGIAALRRFAQTVGLPRPVIVNSGRGLHVYWPMTEVVPVEEWLPVAERLKALCVKHNLIADPVVTADVARVLRVPGTRNFKDIPPRPVNLIGGLSPATEFAEFKKILERDAPILRVVPPPKTQTSSADDDLTSAILGNYRNVFRTIIMKTAAGRGCDQIRHIIEDQATMSEPMWRGGLSIAKFCVDSERAAHNISAKHPGYDPDETARKLDQIKGPYTCETFDKLNPGVCAKCPNKNKIKSPIVLGREVQEATEEQSIVEDVPENAPSSGKQTYVIPGYPRPFFRGVNGGVFKRTKDKQGDPIEIPIYHNDLYLVRRLSDPEIGEAVVVRLHLPRDGVREFTVPLASMLSKDEYRKHMAMHGVAVVKMDELMAYTTAWVNKLQSEAGASMARRQFGWIDKDLTAFVVGDKEIYGSHVEHNPPSNATLRMIPMMHPRGTLEGWKRVAEFYNRPGMEMHQYVLGLSFGSPLVAFSADGAALFHMFSKDTGLGKTTAMRVANSVWGDPGELMCQERDTYATKMNRAEVFKNIFLSIDELTNIQPKEASDFLYQLTGKKQRNRMGAVGNVERFRGEGWKLNVTSTGNSSLLSRVLMYKAMPKAESVRVIETPVQAYKFDSKSETDEFNYQLEEHYGHACIPYMQFVIKNLDECRNLFKVMQQRVDAAADLSQPHRFWSAQAASALAGLTIAKRLGLINYDLKEIFKWIVGQILINKENLTAASGDPEDLLTQYLAENYNNVLRIKSTDDSRGKAAADEYIVPDSAPRLQLVARYEYDIKRLYLLPKPFKEWCMHQQLHYADVVDGLKKGVAQARMRKVRLGKGTRMNLPPIDVLVLDCSTFMSDETEPTDALFEATGA